MCYTIPNYDFAMQHEKGRPLPKFGEWDVNNPASADGFTVIFAKARDENKSTGSAGAPQPPPRRDTGPQHQQSSEEPQKVFPC